MQTHSGIAFWPLDPRPDEIEIADIAHALSMICRFNGHCRRFYSVAEHSCRVAEFVRDRQRPCQREVFRQALLHDAAEAYFGDVVRPIKRLDAMSAYRAAESNLLYMILQKYDCAQATSTKLLSPVVVNSDCTLLATEKKYLMSREPMKWAPMPSAIEIDGHIQQLWVWMVDRRGKTVVCQR